MRDVVGAPPIAIQLDDERAYSFVSVAGGIEVHPGVRADAEGSHWFLAFEALEPGVADALARLRDSVAGVATEGSLEPPGFLIAEIRSR